MIKKLKVFIPSNDIERVKEIVVLREEDGKLVTMESLKTPLADSGVATLVLDYVKHGFNLLLKKILTSESKIIEMKKYGSMFEITEDEYEALRSLLDLVKVIRDIIVKTGNIESLRSVAFKFLRILEDLKIYTLIENKQYDVLAEKVREAILLYQI